MPELRNIPISVLFFKTLAGLGVGIGGMILLLIFVFVGLGTTGGEIISPFQSFNAILMGLTASLSANTLAVLVFSYLDREKYPPVRPVLQHIVSLNVLVFLFLLPIYLLAATQNIPTMFLVAAAQLILSAQASIFALELAATRNSRENLLAVYSVTFGMLLSLMVNLGFYSLANYLNPVAAEAPNAGSAGATALLLAILPVTWFCFGFFTTLVEMIYGWVVHTWGVDYLNRNE